MTLTETRGFRAYKVVGRRDEAQDVVTFTLSAPDNGARAGHHLIVVAPLDPGLRREYSISAITADELEITVKREGIVSSWLHETIHPGNVLTASAPRGSFLLEDRDMPLVLLSCGIGITPMMAMAQEALGRGREVHFVHIARDRAHHAFRKQIDLYRDNGLVSHVTYKYGGDTAECDHVGEFTVDQLREILPGCAVEVKICGPSRFMQAMYDAAVELGVARNHIAWEAFGPSTLVPRTTPNERAVNQDTSGTAHSADTPETPLVTFAESQVTARWDPTSHSLLDFAEEQGVFPNYACRQGSCESCMTRVTDGEFEYVDEPFEAPGEGFVLLCCSRPVTDIELAI
ncbi:ferredoxin-NADP reductase [Mycobacterium frederiksbergense]|uniref:Ferredoxin-NADP reductase n=1 Tax=Mycolicibacterium frederiksbergense TaxID=117567 RepID=A0ABT6L6M4_9MYCO|nr:2Fe-2S iron-sulfur cluster-binding protein [Mycolicibacterium frederiksbergense]MDH6198608.1 ferredoxin-NADP reductase [Mycolicibacterium frederiksbergense]